MKAASPTDNKDCGRALLSALLLNAIAAGFKMPMPTDSQAFRSFRETFNKVFAGEGQSQLPEALSLAKLHTNLAQTDLDRLGVRFRVQQGKHLAESKQTEEWWKMLTEAVPKLSQLTKLNELLGRRRDKESAAWRLFFATRPLGSVEINLFDPKTQHELQRLCKWLEVVGGRHCRASELSSTPQNETIVVGWEDAPIQPLVAITSYRTELHSWNQRVMGKPDLRKERLSKLSAIVRSVCQLIPRPHYVVFPELSIPREWIVEVALAFHRSGISLIAGVEYEIDISKKYRKCHNPAFMFLRSTDLGYNQLRLIRQDKTLPAIEEESELRRISNLELAPKSPFDFKYITRPHTPRPVFQHGNFYFGVLICNELTNIDYRSSFRGKIDGLFVLEWNKDLKTFSPLVESAANDVHCFIIQVNNREYGDSRIRVPAKDEWKRDVVRLQGGENDYAVVGKLDILELRMFQSHYRSAVGKNAKFKPVPTGFLISPSRSQNYSLYEE